MYVRMTKEEFQFLHDLIKENIVTKNTQMREAVNTEEKLAVCLGFLATGNSFRSLGFSTVGKIVTSVCETIWKILGPLFKPNEDVWQQLMGSTSLFSAQLVEGQNNSTTKVFIRKFSLH